MEPSAFQTPVHIHEEEPGLETATVFLLDAIFGYCLLILSSAANHGEFILSSGILGLLLGLCG